MLLLMVIAMAILPGFASADEADEFNDLLEKWKVQYAAAKYRDAEQTAKKALQIATTHFPGEASAIKGAMLILANTISAQSRYDEAAKLFEQALQYTARMLGPEHSDYARCLHNYAQMRMIEGRMDDAERMISQAYQIDFRTHGVNHPFTLLDVKLLAEIYTETGRYIEAEALYKPVLEGLTRHYGSNETVVAEIYTNRASLFHRVGRADEAIAEWKRAIEVYEKMGAMDHPNLSTIFGNLAGLYLEYNHVDEAQDIYEKALQLAERRLGKNHLDVGFLVCNLSRVHLKKRQFDEAKQLLDRSLVIFDATLGPDNTFTGDAQYNLSRLYELLGDDEQAMMFAGKSLETRRKSGVQPELQIHGYAQRGKIAWKLGKKEAALKDLDHAVSLAEDKRTRVSGGEVERAQSFSEHNYLFDILVKWRIELGDTEGAFKAIERSRARSLLEELNRNKFDLEAGRSAHERAAFKERERLLKNKVAEVEQQLEAFVASRQKDEARRVRLRESVEKAREELFDHYREERTTNPVYRNMITRGTSSATFEDLRKKLLRTGDLALVYLFSGEAGYVFVLTSDQAKLITLEVDDAAAKALGISAGPLTALTLHELLIGKKKDGLLPKLSRQPNTVDGKSDASLISRLESLYSILIPANERSAIAAGKFQRLVVMPDSSLAMLPFETLVVRGGQNPEYLLDVGPAVIYGPSASVLCNLADRPVVSDGNRPPVLTVSDPVYPQEKGAAAASGLSADLNQLSRGARYARFGAHLMRLPFTQIEAAAVVDAFTKAGIAMGQLKRELSTEANVRFNVANRKIVHLACHGLADQQYSNFFGALALTPGTQAATNPADDGFLTLTEIYELNLKGCELAILSACETNYGPQQLGEGTWALSRGFLVAGARRVIASNWLVDDEAAANLIGRFSAELAESQKHSEQPDYATILQAAKKSVREQARWRSPYYWSSLVLVGSP